MNIVRPKPNVGDVYVITNYSGREEEAMIIAVNHTGDGMWRAKIFSVTTGDVLISSDSETISKHHWRPRGWVFNQIAGTFCPKEWCVSLNRNLVLSPDSIESADIPVPEKDEHYKTWEKRVFDSLGGASVNSDNVKAKMKIAWDISKESEKDKKEA